MKYSGGCHCGAVRFEVDMTVEKLLACNCSICSKRGYLLAFAPDQNFILLSGEESLSDYQFNKKIIHHYFCKNCGVGAFGQGALPDGTPMRAINVRCLDDFDIAQVPVTPFDGKRL
jgi:hypothetical protein